MPEINKILPKPAKITVPFEDGSITLVYDPLKFNANVQNAAMEFTRRGEDLAEHAYVLSEWIVEWDLTTNNKPYEPTMENIILLGADVNSALVAAIREHRAAQQLARRAAVDDRIAKIAEGPQNGQNSPQTNA